MSKTNSSNFELKTPKGTKDFGPAEMAVREKVFSTIIKVFKKFGAVTIDTPAFELRSVLTSKYGEESSQLIYNLEDQGGELCSLRYDQTVPFARYLAMNKSLKSFKRYQIGKVFRRDQPVLSKGRFREFYQCDFDIAGSGEPVLADAEVLKVIQEVLTDLLGDRKEFCIRLNNRKLLNGIFRSVGILDTETMKKACSIVDKLDKQPWQEVREQLIQASLSEAVADEIGLWVQKKGGLELVEELKASSLVKDQAAKEGLEELELLYKYLQVYGITDVIQLDLSLVRGLDYYTGVIFEAILTGPDTQGLGSVAGGGRYDELVGMFSRSGEQIPCVGVGIGVERLFTILAGRGEMRASPTDVLVIAASTKSTGQDDDCLLLERIRLATKLRDTGFNVEFMPKKKVKVLDQFAFCERNGIPLAVVFGPDELATGVFKLRNMATRTEETIMESELVTAIRTLLSSPLPDFKNLSI